MGRGVVDPLNGSPHEKWALPASLLDSKIAKQAALALLAGKPVVSTDDAVVIRWTGASDTRGTLRIRDADTARKFALEVTVAALDQGAVAKMGRRADPKGVVASIDEWVTVTESTQTWELFNCVVESVILVRA